MNHKSLNTLVVCCCATITAIAQPQKRNVDYVNPFIGTEVVRPIVCGNTFPGACYPFGMVQLSPDTKRQVKGGYDYLPSGYDHKRDSISDFSFTHLNGAGAQDLYDLMMMPSTGEADSLMYLDWYATPFDHNSEKAKAGYYAVRLLNGIDIELTASCHTGMMRIQYPEAKPQSLVIDLSYSEKNYWRGSHGCIDARVEMVNDSTLCGYRMVDGWQRCRRVAFYIQFSRPIHHWVTKGFGFVTDSTRMVTGPDTKVCLDFEPSTQPLLIKTALSPLSEANARENMLTENPGWDMEKVINHTEEAWQKELENITVEGTDKQKTIFYTALYHAYIQPNTFNDCNGQYMKANYESGVVEKGHTYYTTLSLWDTFRAAHPLYTLLKPERVGDFVESMLRQYDSYGFLPIWQLWGTENFGMIGNPAISILVDAALKHIPGVDAERVYKAVKGTSINEHLNSPWRIWNKYGYIPVDLLNQSVSITLELAYGDACVARLAKYLGKSQDYVFFHQRSQFYKNLYRSDKGFFWPKDSHGNWTPFDPVKYGETWYYPITENNGWQYLFSVPHDVEGLVQLMGGAKAFEKKLDEYFTLVTPPDPNGDFGGMIGQYTHGNEPTHHDTYLYNYTSHPDKGRYYMNQIMQEMYTDDAIGYVGNDDCGQTSAWYVLSAMGFYPLDAASGEYELGCPQLTKATVSLPNGRTLTIKTNRRNATQYKMRRILWNGHPLKGHTINHQQLMKGGTLEFVFK